MYINYRYKLNIYNNYKYILNLIIICIIVLIYYRIYKVLKK